MFSRAKRRFISKIPHFRRDINGDSSHTKSPRAHNFLSREWYHRFINKNIATTKDPPTISLSDRTRAPSWNNSKKMPPRRQVLEPTCGPLFLVYPNFDMPRPLRQFRRCSRNTERRAPRSQPTRVLVSVLELFGGPTMRRIFPRPVLLACLKYAYLPKD